MSEQRSGKAGQISWLQLLLHLGLTAVASFILWLLSGSEEYDWWLRLTQRILWGIWFVNALATTLTHVTIFGWSFRRYVRWAGDKMPEWTKFRPSRAPWSKSGKASFSFTVAIVSVTGALGLWAVVMWILKPVTGEFAFRVVITIIGSLWWVTMITLVLIRVAVFGVERQKALREQHHSEPSLVGGQRSESHS